MSQDMSRPKRAHNVNKICCRHKKAAQLSNLCFVAKMLKVLKCCVIVLTIFECSLRMKCLRKVVLSLAGKTDIIGTNYCWERRKLFLWCVGDLFGHTFPEISHGRRWCGWSSDLDPSSTLSYPSHYVPKQATLATPCTNNNNAWWKPTNKIQQGIELTFTPDRKRQLSVTVI